MFAGENCTTPAPVILSMTLSETLRGGGTDDDVGVGVEQLVDRRARDVGRAVTGVGLDLHDLLAEHAAGVVDVLDGRSTPANSGGPRNARSPVCGSRVPIVSVPSPFGGRGALAGRGRCLSPSTLSSLLLPQAVSASDAVASDRSRAPERGWGES